MKIRKFERLPTTKEIQTMEYSPWTQGTPSIDEVDNWEVCVIRCNGRENYPVPSFGVVARTYIDTVLDWAYILETNENGQQ